jgi:hypothetical protein
LKGRLAVNKRANKIFDLKRFNINKLNEVLGKEKYKVRISDVGSVGKLR